MWSCLVRGDWDSQKARGVGMLFRKLLRCHSPHYPGQGFAQLPHQGPRFHSSKTTSGDRRGACCQLLPCCRSGCAQHTHRGQELKSSSFGQVRCGLLLLLCTFSRLSLSFLTAGSQNWTCTSELHLTSTLKNRINNSPFYWSLLVSHYLLLCHSNCTCDLQTANNWHTYIFPFPCSI